VIVAKTKVQVTVTEITKGVCPLGMKVGDTWIIDDKTPNGMCSSAYHTLYPYIRTMSYELLTPSDPVNKYYSCPDRKHWVIYEIKKLVE
jgi:uncharacterized repeat protein (TIGR04076 family)